MVPGLAVRLAAAAILAEVAGKGQGLDERFAPGAGPEMLGTLVSLSLCRELAPVLAALMIAAQAGTALSAEIGIQRATEQIDAIELMDIRAEGFLVGARLLAALFVFPVLASAFVMVGGYRGV